MFNEFFERAISAVNATHTFNFRLSESLTPLRSTPSPNNFDQIVVPVNKIPFSGSVAGVDSGFVSKKLSFIDLVLVKTAGVVFNCDKGALVNSTYYPAPFSFPEPMILRAGLEKDEEQQSISLLRLEKEVSCAIEMIKKFKPEFMFIDGSIVPQYQDKPRKESGVNEDYVSIIHSFQKLYKTAEENSCVLVACVEDSRGTRFRQLLAEEIIPKSKLKIPASSLNGAFDASILDYYLRPAERTFVFPYTKEPESHAILKDYSKEWSESIFVFYLKASEYDKPLRVEFVCKNQKNLAQLSEKISSLVFSLSSLHKEYSFPSILIEADLRAGLSEQEISVVYERLVDRLGTKIRMRRGNRPFG